ncbi:MAG: universal stress protein [Candidatus Bathyarchaeota archaeon]|nr:universal stress protein [Candidatus Bathyarchaeota archaeon]
MFSKILVPLDSSKFSKKSLQVAIEIGKKFNSSLTLIHIIEASEKYKRSGITGKIRKKEATTLSKEEIPEKFYNLLELSKTLVLMEGLSVRTIFMKGNIVEEILQTIKSDKFDLVIMGARGQGPIRKLLLGSVSSGVIEKATCPVLVTRI